MTEFWLVFLDVEGKKYEIIGRTADDTKFTATVAEIAKTGKLVRAHTPSANNLSEMALRRGAEMEGYVEEKGLLSRFSSSK